MFKKASEIETWPKEISPKEFPEGVLTWLDARVMEDMIFPLRIISATPMSPSGLYRAHIRHESSGSTHSTKDDTRLSSATDFQVKTFRDLMHVFWQARQIKAVGGLGIYFNLMRPTFHVDLLAERGDKLTWLVTAKEDGEEYIYLENDPERFFKVLGEQLNKAKK